MEGLDFQAVHDHADALLRDPQTPGDVRSFVQTVFGVASYLNRVEFVTDSDGVMNVVPKSQTPPEEGGSGAVPTPAPAAPESASEEDGPPSPDPPSPEGEPTPSPEESE